MPSLLCFRELRQLLSLVPLPTTCKFRSFYRRIDFSSDPEPDRQPLAESVGCKRDHRTINKPIDRGERDTLTLTLTSPSSQCCRGGAQQLSKKRSALLTKIGAHPPDFPRAANSNRKGSRHRLTPQAKEILEGWLAGHWLNPYPTEEEKGYLAQACHITVTQVGTGLRGWDRVVGGEVGPRCFRFLASSECA